MTNLLVDTPATSISPRPYRLPLVITVCALLGLGSGQVGAHGEQPRADIPQATARDVLSEAIPQLPGQRITLRLVEIPPGGSPPTHRHAGSVAVFVLSGAIRSQLRGQAPTVYRAGESFFEPPGAVHLLSENASASEAARILAIFVADDGAALTTYGD